MIPKKELESYFLNIGLINNEGYPIHIGKFVLLDPYKIYLIYNKRLTKILNFYRNICFDHGIFNFNQLSKPKNLTKSIENKTNWSINNEINWIKHIFLYSLAKTLAMKYKTTISKLFSKYGKNLEKLDTKYGKNLEKLDTKLDTKYHRP